MSSSNICEMCGYSITVDDVEKVNPLWAMMDIIYLDCPKCGKFHIMSGDTMLQLGVSDDTDNKS